MMYFGNEFRTWLLQIFVLWGVALSFGALSRRLRMPAVFGELVGGILLGPTLLGAHAPTFFIWLFPPTGAAATGLKWAIKLGMLCFLFAAGLEVDLTHLRRRIPSILWSSLLGILCPFGLGFASVLLFPALWGIEPGGAPLLLALFIGTALSISAIPVIVRILIDLNLFKSDIGIVITTAAVIDDLVGWLLFTAILGLFLSNGPVGDFSTAISLALTPGAFLLGVALSPRSKKQGPAYEAIHGIVLRVFAPIYFVSIGIRVDFFHSFDPALVLITFLIACLGKIAGAGVGAWIGKMPPAKALAVGFGMNARGAMEIVLATVAFEYGLIDQRIFVALVLMALATSMISGFAIQRLLKRERDAT